MLGWIFKKRDAALASSPAPARRDASTAPAAEPPGGAAVSAAVDWPARLQQAHGDDAALLELARAGAPLDIVQAALHGLVSEPALKQAELAFRDKDRRLFRLVKQRRSAIVAQRQSREQAARLVGSAQALAQDALIPANRLAELDRAWQALDPTQLDGAQRDEFSAAMAQLQALIRQRGDDVLALERWSARARAALTQLQAASAGAAAGSHDRPHLAAAATAARTVFDAAPADSATGDLRDALGHALQAGDHVDARVAFLDELPPIDAATEAVTEAVKDAVNDAVTDASIDAAVDAATDATAEAVRPPNAAPPAAAAPAAAQDPVARWRELASSTPALDDALNRRFEQWRQATRDAERARLSRQRDAAQATARAVRSELAEAATQRLAEALERAEAALADGHLGYAERQFAEIDALWADVAPSDAVRARTELLRADHARLKGWQRWGGGRARDELLLQAEALAAATSAEDDGRVVRLSIQQRAAVVDEMRARWKELDRLGGAPDPVVAASGRWRRFDDALRLAYQPVDAHKAEQRAQREQNLQARQQLLDALDAVPLPVGDRDRAGASAGEGDGDDQRQPDGDDDGGDSGKHDRNRDPDRDPDPDRDTDRARDRAGGGAVDRSAEASHDWRAVAIALDRFDADWRKLGPLEHTVPHAARAPLLERQCTAFGRLEAPLAEARRSGQRVHERLIERARSLGSAAGAGQPGRQHAAQVRELQAEWQQQARAMPLGRATEQALWTDFRAAIDAVFNARQAAFDARDAALKAQGAERMRLVERLERVADDASTRTLEQTLSEVEAQWSRVGAAPRDEAAALESRFRNARDTLRGRLVASVRRDRHAEFDALLDKLALCDALERGDIDAAALASRWQALPGLRAAWEQALAARASAPAAPRAALPSAEVPTDDLLLQVEAAFDLATSEALQQARRALKLQAMKAALEGRQSPGPALSADALLAALLAKKRLDESQRSRLEAIIGALRSRA